MSIYQPKPEDSPEILAAKRSAETDAQWCYNQLLQVTLQDRSEWVAEVHKLRDGLTDALMLMSSYVTSKDDMAQLDHLSAFVDDANNLINKYEGDTK